MSFERSLIFRSMSSTRLGRQKKPVDLIDWTAVSHLDQVRDFVKKCNNAPSAVSTAIGRKCLKGESKKEKLLKISREKFHQKN